jgi:DNA polymerase III subunit gamma/tau
MSEKTPKAANGGGPAGGAYRVLARKYRPSTFEELIGQDAMVKTLSNAFEGGRIAQAYMLSGVRGVGKTTTARILARALNYEPKSGGGAPTLHMPEFGKHCEAIIESRHIDVIEMDAASHTGIDDVREILEGVRYSPSIARYKVYIIDEVHMLSDKAFNAFLKTLEEPPPHVKFIFATTEIRKVPVTVLSRCQRFDLRRVEGDLIAKHLAQICAKEGVKADAEALGIIARAAEGSVRDSLSLLDQAIAHGEQRVKADEVRALLGLADRARVIDLFEALMKGDIEAALKEFRDQYDSGADPATIVADLADFTHLLTRFKLVPDSAQNASLAEAERVRGREMAERLNIRVLSRAWQMLSKGMLEVRGAEKAAQAAEMLLVRIAYAADLPTPDEALKMLTDSTQAGNGAASAPRAPSGGTRMAAGDGSRVSAQATPSPRAVAQPGPRLARFEDVVALAGEKRDLKMKHALENFVRPVRIEEGRLEISLTEGSPKTLPGELGLKLTEWLGRRWVVVMSQEAGGQTVSEGKAQKHDALVRDVRKDPLVEAVLQRFPGAEIVSVKQKELPDAEQDYSEVDPPPHPGEESED